MCAASMDFNPEVFFVEHHRVVDSTNSYARDNSAALWAKACASSIIAIYADEQLAGRGQRGNVWHSAAGENLLVSVVMRPAALPVASQFVLSQAIALAVHRTISSFGIEAQLKWPNDIYVGGRKLAGILVELDCCGSLVEQAVMGVGLNVNQSSFAVMDKVPVSMKMLLGEQFEVQKVLEALLGNFSVYYKRLQSGDYAALAVEYKACLLGYKKKMRYRDASSQFSATIADVCSDGRIMLERADGTIGVYAFKEVELLL